METVDLMRVIRWQGFCFLLDDLSVVFIQWHALLQDEVDFKHPRGDGAREPSGEGHGLSAWWQVPAIPAAPFPPHLPFMPTSQHFLSLFVKCWVYGGRVWGKPLLQLRLALVLFKTDWKFAPLELRVFFFFLLPFCESTQN